MSFLLYIYVILGVGGGLVALFLALRCASWREKKKKVPKLKEKNFKTS